MSNWVWTGILAVLAYLVCMFVWLQHLMIKQRRDNEAVNDRVSRLRDHVMEKLDTILIVLDDKGDVPEEIWTDPPKPLKRCNHQWRTTTNGYFKCMECGAVEERWE